jgi:hypothetical protein
MVSEPLHAALSNINLLKMNFEMSDEYVGHYLFPNAFNHLFSDSRKYSDIIQIICFDNK